LLHEQLTRPTPRSGHMIRRANLVQTLTWRVSLALILLRP